ncbi:hypothetical protein [Pseudoclavibacter helvolus]|uniref:hypothetical protein n=1 Tax=Pseudoclavibacter helvolus TaxID=255205 RepID=UPI003C743C74
MKKLTPADDSATRPIELPRTNAATSPDAPPHREHGWVTASRHSTSLGVVVYSVCASCGAHRAELHEPQKLFPEPISRPSTRNPYACP